MRSAVLIPVKSFDLAKKRLGPALSDRQRADLARSMAGRVVAAAAELRTFVVCGDKQVAAWARSAGCDVIWFPEPGLNPAVTFGVDHLGQLGFGTVIIAHADLPLASSLGWVGDFDGVSIVRDRRGEGTNVMAVPTHTGFTFQYGEGSSGRHEAEAKRLNLGLRIVDDPELGWDVDMPHDLADLPNLEPERDQ